MVPTAPAISHLLSLLDDTGLAQHATYTVIAREHGYCLDDNARGLILAVTLQRLGLHRRKADILFSRTAAFVQHAWNKKSNHFRNFMSFDRQWQEEDGSDDSHGRAVWALGTVARDAGADDARRWAIELLKTAAPSVAHFQSLRPLAYALLGIVACRMSSAAPELDLLQATLADRLHDHLRDSRRANWVWFEDRLTYDNAQLANALLTAAPQVGLVAGLDALSWLCRVQTSETGRFRPVGSNGFWHHGAPRAQYDQQPIEAAATVAAALRAWYITGNAEWFEQARRAHAWFLGANDLDVPLVVNATGGCHDGLHPDRVNANQGAESTLAWLQTEFDFGEAAGRYRSGNAGLVSEVR